MKNIGFVFILLSLTTGFAQEEEQDSIKQLSEVLITARSAVFTALSITVKDELTKADLTQASPIDFASRINQIPGVFVLSGALNTNRITLRGIGARTPYGTNKLRLYLNNIPLTNGSGVSTIAAIDLEDLEGLTVVKGPKASAYGSNLGGAILLNRDRGSSLGTSFSNAFTLGSYQLVKNNSTLQYRTEKSQVGLKYSLMDREGYRENSSFNRQAFRFDYQVAIGSKSDVTFLIDQVNYKAYIPSSVSLDDFQENPRQAAFTWAAAKGYEQNRYTLMGLNFGHQLSPKLKSNTSVFYSYLDHYEPRPFNILEEFIHGYGFRSVFSGTLGDTPDRASYILGAELYKDQYAWRTFENLYRDNNGQGSLAGEQLSDNQEQRNQLALFGSFSYALNAKWQMMLGLNFNKTKYTFEDQFNTGSENTSASRNFDGILSPSLSVNYQVNTSFKLHGNVSRGFSNPGLEETLTPEGVVNPAIEQEKGMNYELGLAAKLFRNSLWINLDLYQMNIKNLLVAQRIGEDQYVGVNAGETRHRGIELSLRYLQKIGPTFSFSPQLSYELTKHRFVDFVQLEQDYSGNKLTGVPAHRLNTTLNLNHLGGWYFNLNHQFIDEIPLDDANTLHSSAYTIVGSKMGYAVSFFNKIKANVYVGVNNVFNKNYATSVLINAVGFGTAQPRYYYPSDGRNFYGGIQLKYEL